MSQYGANSPYYRHINGTEKFTKEGNELAGYFMIDEIQKGSRPTYTYGGRAGT